MANSYGSFVTSSLTVLVAPSFCGVACRGFGPGASLKTAMRTVHSPFRRRVARSSKFWYGARLSILTSREGWVDSRDTALPCPSAKSLKSRYPPVHPCYPPIHLSSRYPARIGQRRTMPSGAPQRGIAPDNHASARGAAPALRAMIHWIEGSRCSSPASARRIMATNAPPTERTGLVG